MATIIIQNRNRISNLLKTVLISYILICCSYKSVPVSSEDCKLTETSFAIKNLSSDLNSIYNTELNVFYESHFKYDILFYSSEEGSNTGVFERWFYNQGNNWTHISIKEGQKKETKFVCSQEEIEKLFSKVKGKEYMQNCVNCYDCMNYTLIMKSHKLTFKYISNGKFFTNLNDIETEDLSPYARIFNYFSSLTL